MFETRQISYIVDTTYNTGVFRKIRVEDEDGQKSLLALADYELFANAAELDVDDFIAWLGVVSDEVVVEVNEETKVIVVKSDEPLNWIAKEAKRLDDEDITAAKALITSPFELGLTDTNLFTKLYAIADMPTGVDLSIDRRYFTGDPVDASIETNGDVTQETGVQHDFIVTIAIDKGTGTQQTVDITVRLTGN